MHPCQTEGHRSCATPQGMAKADSGPINRRGGAPRGERPPAARIAKADPRGDARTRVSGPIKNGCRCTQAPFGAPLPLAERDEYANLGGHMPREKDDACAVVGWAVRAFTPVFDGLWARSAVPTWTPPQSQKQDVGTLRFAHPTPASQMPHPPRLPPPPKPPTLPPLPRRIHA
jgi:hypothetical protein